MAEGIITVDDDWKRQAQQEKQRLAEEAATKAAKPVGAGLSAGAAVGGVGGGAAGGATAGAAGGAAGADGRGRARREAPEASFTGLVQSLMTQAMYYLGELAQRGGEPAVDLDMAKYQLDLLFVLEQKCAGSMTADEKKLMDQVLYEVRMRFVSVASQYLQ